jgi:hypothetical protein
LADSGGIQIYRKKGREVSVLSRKGMGEFRFKR